MIRSGWNRWASLLERWGAGHGMPRDSSVFVGSMVTVLALMYLAILPQHWVSGSVLEWLALIFLSASVIACGFLNHFVLTKFLRSRKAFISSAFTSCMLTCGGYFMVHSIAAFHPSTLLFLRLWLSMWGLTWLDWASFTIVGLPSQWGWGLARATAWPLSANTMQEAANLLGRVAFLLAIPVPWEVVLPSMGHVVCLGVFSLGWLCVLLVGTGKPVADTAPVEVP